MSALLNIINCLEFVRDNPFWGFGRVRKIAESDYELRHVFPSVNLSFRIELARTRRIFMKFDSWLFFEKLQFWLKSDKNNEYFTWIPVYIYDNLLIYS